MMRRTVDPKSSGIISSNISKTIQSSQITNLTGGDFRIEFFQQVSDSVRHSILSLLLKEGQISVSDILSRLDKPQTLISYHLRCLKDMGLVNSTKDKDDGRKTLYSLHSPKTIQNLFKIADSYVVTHSKCGNESCKIE